MLQAAGALLLLITAPVWYPLLRAWLGAWAAWWRVRHIPGPAAWPLLGNYASVAAASGIGVFVWRCQQRYGPVFLFWLGTRPVVVLSDAQLARKVNMRSLERNVGVPELAHNREDLGMLLAKRPWRMVMSQVDKWRTMRTAWQPAFSSASLERYHACFLDCATRLREHLAGAAASGQAVDLLAQLSKVTLQAVGSTAFGVELQTLDWHGATERGQRLLDACEAMFDGMAIQSGRMSPWVVAAQLLGPLLPLIRQLALHLPDRELVRLTKAKRLLHDTAMDLIQQWRLDHPAPTAADPEARPAAEPAGVAPDRRPAAPGGKLEGGRASKGHGCQPGSFLGLLLAARDRGTGAALTDLQVAAQAEDFIVAGYETTANTMACMAHAVASHPQVEARVLAEVDAFGRDRQPRPSDLVEHFPYLTAVMKETLRCFCPVRLLVREIAEGMELGGHQVPAGTQVWTSNHSLHMSTDGWGDDASEFKPERWLGEGAADEGSPFYAPFGIGPRMCIGYRFAQHEALATLATLYQRYRFELRSPGPLRFAERLTTYPADGVVAYVRSR